MNTSSTISLGELLEPSPGQFSYNTPGWYLVFSIVLVFLISIIWLSFLRYRHNRYRYIALDWMEEREYQLLQHHDYSTLVYESNMLIKRILLNHHPRHLFAGLRGRDWIRYVNSTTANAVFDAGDEHLLETEVYSHDIISEEQARAFALKTKRWLLLHKL